MDGLHKVKKQEIEEKKQRKKKTNTHRMTDSKFDYGESDDWVWGYGSMTKDNEYVINISGGGDGVSPNGFEDWVIQLSLFGLKYYIRHGGDIPDKEQKGMKLFSCPEGNYVSFQDNDYKPREGEMDFDWLEEQLDSMRTTDPYDEKKIDSLEKANKFLKNITEEQTKKIEELKKENGEIMDSLDTAVSNKTRALEEENQKLKKDNEAECDENKALKEIIIGLKPQGTYLLSAEAEIKKLEEEIKNIKRSYEVLKSEFQQKRDALQQHNEILMEELCGSTKE